MREGVCRIDVALSRRAVYCSPSFQKDAPKLGSSRSRALSQFYALEAKLSKDNALATQYREFMEEYINMGHMQEAPQSHVNSPVYYIPHHSVVNPDSQTTRLRVVFNASSKTSTGYSLNDALSVGATIQPDLFSLTLRFRTHVVALSADIAKMYRQIQVYPRFYDWQRIFWRPEPQQPVQEYQLKTNTYGTASAPLLRCARCNN